MAQDRYQLDQEVAALLKARSEIDGKLDAAQEKRANWREGDEERRAKSIKRESAERDGGRMSDSIATMSPSEECRSHSRRGKRPELPMLPREIH